VSSCGSMSQITKMIKHPQLMNILSSFLSWFSWLNKLDTDWMVPLNWTAIPGSQVMTHNHVFVWETLLGTACWKTLQFYFLLLSPSTRQHVASPNLW
jgi:hypothetical protein